MGVKHRAYFFDPVLFHIMLENRIVEQDHLRLDLLLTWAEAIVANASDITRQVLRDIRFDPDWFDTSDDDVSNSDMWYMIALTQVISPAPSLSSPSSGSHFILRRVLPVIGWTKAEACALYYGSPLSTLVKSSGNALLIAEFNGVDQFGAWISLESAQSLLLRLQADKEHFFSPGSKELQSLAWLADHGQQVPAEVLVEAYSDATVMLQAAIERRAALFVTVD